MRKIFLTMRKICGYHICVYFIIRKIQTNYDHEEAIFVFFISIEMDWPFSIIYYLPVHNRFEPIPKSLKKSIELDLKNRLGTVQNYYKFQNLSHEPKHYLIRLRNVLYRAFKYYHNNTAKYTTTV